MATMTKPPGNSTRAPEGLLGPHFYYDLLRLARKGWPTFARVLYLAVLLVSLAVMYRTQGGNAPLVRPAEFAQKAISYTYTLIVLQNLLVLVLLPVYVASAIAEEKEHQTLEALTLTHLTDRELVLGKLFARVMHVGAIVLSSFPLLVFMHLWGNVEIELLIYHEINTLLVLLSAGSLCIWHSSRSESVFQAVSGAYPWMGFMALFCVGFALMLPWMVDLLVVGITLGEPQPAYLPALPLLFIGHGIFIYLTLQNTISQMENARREERRNPRKSTGAVTLADNPKPTPKTGKRGETRSRIHPWAWPIGGDALWWKECLKDGTSWSLSIRWALIGLGLVPIAAILYRILIAVSPDDGAVFWRNNAYSLTFTAYFVALAAYALVVVFQMTMSVAAEREQGTIGFLLMIPTERRSILWAKWIGPWWRNWPILAIAYLGVALGLGCGLYGFGTALLLFALPLPFLLMLGGLALWLSVICRRVLYANIAMVGFLGLLFIAHVAAGEQTQIILAYFIALVGERPLENVIERVSPLQAAALALGEQAVFLVIAAACLVTSFRMFARRDYAGT